MAVFKAGNACGAKARSAPSHPLLHSGLEVCVAERLFDDPDFRYFNEGATAKAECKHCGARMFAIEADAHRQNCPHLPRR